MILYFADRHMRIQGQASTSLPRGFKVIEDLKTEEIETGVATFSCRIAFDNKSRLQLKNMTAAGNYLLRSNDNENEFYTIIDREIDTKNKEIYIYAEDAGLDLINEIVGEFEADGSYSADWYINKYIVDSGFEIGLNEIPATSKRKLAWDGEATVTARLASIATEFGCYEISYSYAIKGLEITHKYVNIHEKRGQDNGVTLRLNSEIDKIVTSESVANLATAFLCEGGVPDNEETAITFSNTGYKYDDGDFFIDGDKLKSRKANEKWSRYVWNKEPNKLDDGGGYIVRPYSYNTTDPGTLCSHAIAELKKVCDVEVNYEIDVNRLPENVKIGDRINIVDDASEMYVSTRILKLEKSVIDQKSEFTLGDHLIKTSGISQKVTDLAAQFAKTSQSVARAQAAAEAVKTIAQAAEAKAEAAESVVAQAQEKAEEAKAAAETATQSAENAEAKALAAQAAVEKVESSVSSMETTIENAKTAAQNAEKAAEDATALADEAKQAAQNAVEDVADAKSAGEAAQAAAASATTKANEATAEAGAAKTLADAASATAQAAKLDAEQAQKDVEAWGESLETEISTMSASYARKTELTETKADLQAQIKRNAGLLSSTITGRTIIDETANDAATLAEKAQAKAQKAQELATEAAADAQEAQAAANEAAQAAASAQAEADTAQAAADEAQSILDQATADLEAAKEDLATISGRADATEAEIAAAEKAVEDAQAAADTAQANATSAIETANSAQAVADAAAKTAEEAQDTAALAALNAQNAQALSKEMAAAYDAVLSAQNAQSTANKAVEDAKTAQQKADKAVEDAVAADNKAKAAAQTVANAKSALNTAKQNLADTLAKVGATEAEIAAAEQAVRAAQAEVDAAIAAAAAASGAAAAAAEFAAVAQDKADEAKSAADNAKTAADGAKAAADKAQADADALEIRVKWTETQIEQTDEKIALSVKSIEFGGRNLLLFTKYENMQLFAGGLSGHGFISQGGNRALEVFGTISGLSLKTDTDYTVSFTAWVDTTDASFRQKITWDLWPDTLPQEFVDDLSNEPKRYSFVINSSHSDMADCKVRFFTYEADAEGYFSKYPIYVTDIQLEKGNKATDWTISPEDVDKSIMDAQTTADEAYGRVEAAESLIQQLADSISMLVTDGNGQSLMTQTSTGWTFSMAETAEAVEALKDALSGLQKDSGDLLNTLSTLDQAIKDSGEKLEYVTVTTYENEPCIALGESDSDFKLLITNTRIMFMNGGNTPTYINTNGLVTQNIEVKGEIVQGGYVMLNTSDGGWGLLWKGGSE